VERLSGDTDLAVASGAALTFTPANFATPQLITISAAHDADAANDAAVFRVLAPGIASHDAIVNGIDNDGATPPPAQSAVSRKVHGTAGVFDVPLPLTGMPGVESRAGGASGDYQVVITFASPVTVEGSFQAGVTAGAGVVGVDGASNGGAVSVSGTEVTVPLTNVTDAQTIAITLFDVNQGANSGDVTVPMSVLVGDTNGNGQVNSTDIGETKALSGAAVTAGTFRNDVIANGTINSSDVGLVKSKSGNALP